MEAKMEHFYTDEINIQILLALMKAHGIKKIVASPGTTNISFIASAQQDPDFEIFSSVDERSAAYIACGMAAESGEPVALSCTGATASRNYLPGLTEAFYRKLPVLAITATRFMGNVGQYEPQTLDRSSVPNDVVKMSVPVRIIHSSEDKWECERNVNEALLELRHEGGGPVHINLETVVSRNFTVKELPKVRVINRVGSQDPLPQLQGKKVGIFVGAHKKWTEKLTQAVDSFCEKYNGVVFCDHTSNYRGKYRILPSLVASQDEYRSSCRKLDVMIHIGEVSGSYVVMYPKEVWRIDPDGKVRDTFKKLRYIFELEEEIFFEKYLEVCQDEMQTSMSYFEAWKKETDKALAMVPELPFSNIWIAKNTIQKLPKDSILYLGILNTLRTWNYFESSFDITEYANTGGFGIDGSLSSLVGASLVDKNRLCFGIIGDLSMFYDMNAIGNRYVQRNLRIMVINNGRGTEFRNYTHPGSMFGEAADKFIAAAGHFGNQSPCLLKHYAQDLGFKYLSASNKEEYLAQVDHFLTAKMTDAPMLFEVFTNSVDESNALKGIRNLPYHQYDKNKISELLGNGKKAVVGIYAATVMAKKIIAVYKTIETLKDTQIIIFDGNEEKRGTIFEDYEIYSPSEILKQNVERLIIANDMYFDEIYEKQKYLEEYGVEIVGIENV